VAGSGESVIQFIDGDELEVKETVDKIDRAIGDLRTGRVPLIRVHSLDGREHRVNATHIKTIRRNDTSA
jgi:uncharacterized protein YlzI (FlbEa/FlbD family)